MVALLWTSMAVFFGTPFTMIGHKSGTFSINRLVLCTLGTTASKNNPSKGQKFKGFKVSLDI